MICDSFKTFCRSDLLFNFDHLSKLTVRNNDLHEFVVRWNAILDNMGDYIIDKDMLKDVFFRRVKDEKELEYDIKMFERLDDTDEGKSYDHLMKCVERVIKVQDKRRNLLEKGDVIVQQAAEKRQ